MKLLLDTHTFLWADHEPAKLSAQARALLSDPTNERLLSVASLWEMQIKSMLGKLTLRLPLPELIREHELPKADAVASTLARLWRSPDLFGEAHPAFRGCGATRGATSDSSSAFPRFRAL